MILVTGGAGFIGSNFVLDWIAHEKSPVVNLDKLTYAGNLDNLSSLAADPRHLFVKGDVRNRNLVLELLEKHRPHAIVHFAAESHVDRSIVGPGDFVETNIVGTFSMLECARSHWQALPQEERSRFVFLHVSTDEVYGSLGPQDPCFSETTRYSPNSPYSASKAGSDHLVRAYHHTYGLPVLITNCSNNYGPRQFPEKFIPLMLLNALAGKPLPVYGDGLNRRDWLYVSDHCKAIRLVLSHGRPGETYNIGGNAEMTNLEVIDTLCAILDESFPDSRHRPHRNMMEFVRDRPGHDRRYAMDTSKIRSELGWAPEEVFETGLRKTVHWYLSNRAWVESVVSGDYRKWIETNYALRSRS